MVAKGAEETPQLLILTPFGKDAEHLCKVLLADGYICHPCKNIADLVNKLSDDINAILITEEILASREALQLVEVLRHQPTWSAMPIIAFYSEGATLESVQKKANHPLQTFTNINFLKRPVGGQLLASAVRTAVSDRRRQYRIRNLLVHLQNDLQKQKVYEAELKQGNLILEEAKTMAQEASRSKSQFLANMSHEIRTPLGAIMGFLDLLKNPGNTAEEVKAYISVIDRNSVQLLRLIDDILDLSKVEAGKMIIEHLEFSLHEVLADFASLMGYKAKEKGITFQMDLATPIPRIITSDPTRVLQILTNIVGNAIKFTEKGFVKLEISYIKRELKFTITDSGRGISAEQAKGLFQLFSQADSSTTRRFGGTGLGLVLTQRLCREMGGNFRLEKSELGKGSQFVATLMVGEENTDMIHERDFNFSSEQDADRLKGMKVLLVEDIPDNQNLLTILLNRLGVQVSVASNGREAIKQTKQDHYDALLMDIQMPEMDGHEATHLLRKEGYKVPIIALTAHAMHEERERILQNGFSDFLTKPIDREALLRALLYHRH